MNKKLKFKIIKSKEKGTRLLFKTKFALEKEKGTRLLFKTKFALANLIKKKQQSIYQKTKSKKPKTSLRIRRFTRREAIQN